jgi:hypothetical protein
MARRKDLYEVDGELVSEKTPPARGMPESRVLAVNPIERVECHGDPGKSPVPCQGPRSTPPGAVGACISENARCTGNSYLHGHQSKFRQSSTGSAPKVRFALDSVLEGAGFEPPVPREKASSFYAEIRGRAFRRRQPFCERAEASNLPPHRKNRRRRLLGHVSGLTGSQERAEYPATPGLTRRMSVKSKRKEAH